MCWETAAIREPCTLKCLLIVSWRGASCAVGCALKCVMACHYSKGFCATVCEAMGATVAEGLCA